MNYSYRHPDPGLAAPAGVSVESRNEAAATVALGADGIAMVGGGVAAGVAVSGVKHMGVVDECEVTVGEPQLLGLAIDTAHAVYAVPPVVKPVAGAGARVLSPGETVRRDDLAGMATRTGSEQQELDALNAVKLPVAASGVGYVDPQPVPVEAEPVKPVRTPAEQQELDALNAVKAEPAPVARAWGAPAELDALESPVKVD